MRWSIYICHKEILTFTVPGHISVCHTAFTIPDHSTICHQVILTYICIIPKSPFSLLQGGSDFVIPDQLSVSYNVMLTFTIPDHIFSCYQLYGSEGSCTISTTDIQLDYRLRDENLTLTFPNASREDGGLYTLEMHVNDAKLNTTSCTLNIQERSGTYLVPLYSYQNEMEYRNNYIAMCSTRWTLNHLGQMHCFNSAHFSSE